MSEGSETRGLGRSMVLAAVAILVGLSAPAGATLSMMHTYRTGIDIGNDAATGCDFDLGSVAPNTLPGFELQVTVVVDADLMPPQVVSAQVETCSGDGGSFGGAQALPGFVLEIDSGLLGSDSVVGAIPRSLLGDSAVVRLAHHALSGDGSEDALFTRDGTPGGAAITAPLSQPAPAPLLSGLGIALAVLLLFGVGFSQWRQGGWGAAAVLALMASSAVIAYAAFGDPAAVDDPADAVPPDSRAEIVASFAMTTDSELGLRLDIENIVFVPPTETPTETPTQTPTETPTSTPTPFASMPIGAITGDIVRGGMPTGSDRGVESAAGNLVADAQQWATSVNGAEIAFMNPGGVRSDLTYAQSAGEGDGVVTYGEAFTLQPFGNTLVTFAMTGSQIVDVLEEQCQPAGSSRPFLHLGVSDGLTYDLSKTIAGGDCTAVSITNLKLNGNPVLAGTTYNVTVNSFLAIGGDNFDTFATIAGPRLDGGNDLQALTSYLGTFSPVAPPSTDRVNEI